MEHHVEWSANFYLQRCSVNCFSRSRWPNCMAVGHLASCLKSIWNRQLYSHNCKVAKVANLSGGWQPWQPCLVHSMSGKLLEIDGSFGQGGGQILRTSLTLSLLTGRPFRLYNIRAGRSKPGLQPQHLMSVQAAAKIGQAKLRGASRGSSDLTFEPRTVTAGNYRFDIGTAGATSLVLQTIALPLALRGGAPSHATLIGGTHVSTSP